MTTPPRVPANPASPAARSDPRRDRCAPARSLVVVWLDRRARLVSHRQRLQHARKFSQSSW